MHFSLPQPADAAAAARVLADFTAQHGAPEGDLAAILRGLGGNSPYLAGLALREPDALRGIAAQGPDAVCDRALSDLATLTPALPRPTIAAGLREAKRLVSLSAAIADLAGLWTLDQVTGALSDLADGALAIATAHLLRAAHDRGELRLPHPASPARASGFTVLAMGKLGARELNFSSDVDLILVFDPEAHPYREDTIGATFARLARDLVTLMQLRDAGGTVFRVDLRLRPDPGSTPPAISLPAALTYYESQAQTWERAAMIKARPVAGDLLLGRRFLAAIRPFVWRRHLDFAAIADIRAMKRRMDGHRGAALAAGPDPVARLLGHDLKLGEGGIREAEFCAQILQLVWGGRNPVLRAPATRAALSALAASGHLPQAEADNLTASYMFLRQAEHRLQMVADQQTHSLPATAEGFTRFAVFMGSLSPAALAETILTHLQTVHVIFAGLFAAPPGAPGSEAEPAETPWPPGGAAPPWQSWLAGRPRALRTERARALLLELLPAISASIERQPHPEAAWARLDEFIYRLPQGVQIFSLLRHNPALLDRLGDVLGAAPWLAGHLAETPSALEGLASPLERGRAAGEALAAMLRDSGSLDEALGTATRTVRGEEFAIAVGELDLRLDVDQAASARTNLAGAAIAGLRPLVLREHERRFGRLPGGGIAIVALGKAGSHEMMAGSDLDLMLIYDHRPHQAESTGPRPIAASQYFARAAQAIVAALTVPTRDGPLYQVDMRLRPSGNAGPVAVSLDAFRHYHAHGAWTWERLALTRARVIAGPRGLTRRIEAAIHAALRAGDPAAIMPDTAAMRARLKRELPQEGPWDVKLREGGLMEVEFIAQALQLRHASNKQILHPNTGTAFRRLENAGFLSPADAATLIEADRTWRTVQGMLRITQGRDLREPPSATVLDKLARVLALQVANASLPTRLDSMAENVHAAFTRLIGGPTHPMTLATGDHAPAFTLQASRGRNVSSEALHGKPYVLYFYPKADTTGCTKEACAFQEALPQLGKIGLEIIGVSRDPIKALDKFADKYSLDFPLASDEAGALTEAYGVWVEKSMYGRKYMGIERSTYLIDAAGRVAQIWPKVKIDGHAEEVLNAARGLAKAG